MRVDYHIFSVSFLRAHPIEVNEVEHSVISARNVSIHTGKKGWDFIYLYRPSVEDQFYFYPFGVA